MKKEVNKDLPNQLTLFRIVLSVFILIILLFPFNMVNISFPKYLINDTVIIDIKLVICAFLFIIASLTDFLDGYIARKYNLVTDFGKMIDAIADKILVNGMLIALAGEGYIGTIIPIVVVLRDTVVNSIKMVAGNKGDVVAAIKTGKFKTAFLMVGIILKLLGNYPFGLINVAFDDFCLITGTVLSLVSGIEYYFLYRKYLKN